MTEELKSAIRTIAEYDGFSNYLFTNGSHFALKKDNPHYRHILHYHTSADALLPVWRKVYEYYVNKCDPNDTDEWVKMFGDSYLGISGAFDVILYSIGMNKLDTACIKLAEIISQLNEQK